MPDGERDSAPGPAPDGDGPGEEAEEPDATLVTPHHQCRRPTQAAPMSFRGGVGLKGHEDPHS